jgi:SAM-dependent methyltransferase
MVTDDEVRNAFRFILGREIEDAAVIRHFTSQCKTFGELRAAFLNCEEFQSAHARRQPISRGHPIDIAIQKIDTRATPEALAEMMARVEATWDVLGATEPWWSVLTADHYRAVRFDAQTEAAFYASGEHDVRRFRSAASRAGIDLSKFGCCFELGCGVGRLTHWLARIFPEVVGADISASHLRIAHQRLRDAGHDAVRLLLYRDYAAFEDLPSFDAFFSVIVLQHNPPPLIRYVLERVLSRLSTGGIGFFQIPTNIVGYEFDSAAPRIEAVGQMEMHAFPQPALFELIEDQGCRVLELREDHITSPKMLSNIILLQKVR